MASGSPELTLKDLIDISAFQKLSESYSQLTGMAAALLDLRGEILVASGWKEICTEFHRKNPGTASRCLESDTVLAGQLAQGGEHNIYKCKNGLVDVAVPIFVENVHVGNLFIGQFLLEPADRRFFARQAEEFGFDQDSYLAALAKVPILSMEHLDRAIDFLVNLTVLIGTTGLDKKRLFEWKRHLEKRIQVATAELTDSNRRLRVLSEASFEGIILSENGVVVEANDKVAAMLGYQRAEELLGIKVTNFIAPERRKDVEDKMSSGYEEAYESFGVKRDGTIFPIEIHGKTFSYQGRLARGSAIRDLTEQKSAQNEIQTLRNILPICSFCKKIRDDQGYWEQVDVYIRKHTETDFSHSICPECMKKHYPKELRGMNSKEN